MSANALAAVEFTADKNNAENTYTYPFHGTKTLVVHSDNGGILFKLAGPDDDQTGLTVTIAPMTDSRARKPLVKIRVEEDETRLHVSVVSLAPKPTFTPMLRVSVPAAKLGDLGIFGSGSVAIGHVPESSQRRVMVIQTPMDVKTAPEVVAQDGFYVLGGELIGHRLPAGGAPVRIYSEQPCPDYLKLAGKTLPEKLRASLFDRLGEFRISTPVQ